jgi:integrase
VLKAWQERQLFERLEWDAAWQDSGRVFTREDGAPLRRGWASEHFKALVRKAGLPPVRFHDLRHGTGTMLLAAGQPIKVISEILGHATSAFTAACLSPVPGSSHAEKSRASGLLSGFPLRSWMVDCACRSKSLVNRSLGHGN